MIKDGDIFEELKDEDSDKDVIDNLLDKFGLDKEDALALLFLWWIIK